LRVVSTGAGSKAVRGVYRIHERRLLPGLYTDGKYGH
jgi:hypothetical protein